MDRAAGGSVCGASLSNAIACGTPDASGATVVTISRALYFLRMRLRMHRASGVPRALIVEGGNAICHGAPAPQTTGRMPRVYFTRMGQAPRAGLKQQGGRRVKEDEMSEDPRGNFDRYHPGAAVQRTASLRSPVTQ